MRSSRRRRPRRPPARIVGYGGASVLVVAAIVVLLMPLLDRSTGGRAAAGAQPQQRTVTGGALPSALGTGPPSAPPSDPVRQGGGQNPAGQGGGAQPGQGGQMPLPEFGGGAGSPCADGVGTVQQAGPDLRVVVRVSGTAIAQVEVHLSGQTSRKKDARLSGGRPHTFVFKGVPAGQVERVQLRTVGTMVPQSCDLPLG